MNNSTSDDRLCALVISITPQSLVILYMILFPICFLVSTFGRLIGLVTFCHHSKSESPYLYQIFASSSDLFKMFASLLYIVVFRILSGVNGSTGSQWFMSGYHLMTFAVRLPMPLMNVAVTTSLLFSLSMVIDRTFALTRPFRYRSINHRRSYVVTCVVCPMIGVLTSIVYAFRWNIEPFEDRYRIVSNDRFMSTIFAKFLSQTCIVVRLIALILLIGFNAVLVRHYRLQVKKFCSAPEPTNIVESKRKEQEKVLTIVAICQGVFTALPLLLMSVQQTLFYLIHNAQSLCYAPLLMAMVEFIVGVCDMIDFYVMFAVSKQFRLMVGDAAFCYKG